MWKPKQIFNLENIYANLVAILLFLVPSNLFLKFSVSSGYVSGLLVDYLLPKLYLSDLIIFGLFLLWAGENIFSKTKIQLPKIRSNWLVLSLLLAILVKQFSVLYPLAAGWYVLKMIEFVGLFFFLSSHRKIFSSFKIQISLIATIIFQSLVAFWQWFTQASLFSWKFLGEPNLSHSIGLNKDVFFQTGRVLPYGTTAHPNILAGILAVFIFLLLHSHKKYDFNWLKYLSFLSIILGCITILLTQSVSGVIALLLGVVFPYRKINFKKMKLSKIFWGIFLLTPVFIKVGAHYFDSPSFLRRDFLQTAAVRMIKTHPLTGVGLNQFTAKVEYFSSNPEIVRFVQPVHHLGLLWIAETGLLGGILLVVLLRKNKHAFAQFMPIMIILLPIMVLDHYLLTQQSGVLMGVIALIFYKNISAIKTWTKTSKK